jgi:F-type H+-transporting ATPase subunit delta
MGSASRQALRTAVETLAAAKGVSIATGEQLMTAGRAVEESGQLRTVLGDPAIAPDEKAAIVARIFPGLEKTAAALLTGIVQSRWSNGDELVAGIEEIGVRAIAQGDGHTKAIESELFAFARIVASDPELELALGNKLAEGASKAALVDALLAEKAHPGTLAIVDHLVRSPRGRRVGEMFAQAADLVAASGGRRIATVTSAAPLSAKQQDRLAAALTKQYDTDIQLNAVVDPAVIGGVRIQIGDDVIDGTVAARLADLRLQLAG